jgi:hypothetical protein
MAILAVAQIQSARFHYSPNGELCLIENVIHLYKVVPNLHSLLTLVVRNYNGNLMQNMFSMFSEVTEHP